MPRTSGISVDNSFVRGLVTEATGLSFPENACTETFDCVFNKTGEVTRRLGFDYESSYSLFSLTAARSNSAVSSFLWTGAGGDGDSSFVCVQVGQYIYFYAVGEDLSAGKHSTSIDLSSFVVAGSTLPYSYKCNFAEGDGKLFVVSKFTEPFYVDYTPSTNTISSGTQITIEVRDLQGDTADPYDVDERPTATVDSVDIHHLYNLWNQGWSNDVATPSGGTGNPVTYWDSQRTTIPSNADRWWLFKDSSGDLNTDDVDEVTWSSGQVPRGFFIYNAFNVDRNDAVNSDGVSMDTEYTLTGETQAGDDLTIDSTDLRPTSVAFFANRVWYAGVDDSGYNSNIYFSRVLTDIAFAGRCFQEQDPTDEGFSDLLDTDGGVIVIPGIANVYHMMEARNSLILFASNGIWQIGGSEGIGFKATDFFVTKISNLQNVDNHSYVNLNGIPCWINGQGIWLLQRDESLGSTNVTSLTEESIQSFFDDIPPSSIRYIQGTYNQKERLVYWIYRSTQAGSIDGQYSYDRCLIFNTETGAFYPWTLSTNQNIMVTSVIAQRGFSTDNTEDAQVIDSSLDTVIDSSSDNVVANFVSEVAVPGEVKFFVENNSDQVTFADANDTGYVDWATPLGTGRAYSSYFVTGYKLRGEAIRKQKSNYIRVFSRVQSGSSVKVQGVWDYYTSDGARWSREQEGYKAQAGSTYSERRLKIRGNGLALQVRFASEAGMPFNVIGWSMWDSINNVP